MFDFLPKRMNKNGWRECKKKENKTFTLFLAAIIDWEAMKKLKVTWKKQKYRFIW